MKPILYDSAENAFTTNGIGILSDAISCIVKQEVNGQYELTLQYPLNGIHADGLKLRNIILAKPDPVSDSQPFRIYKIHKPMNDVVTVNARHIVYDLAGIVVAPFAVTTAPLAMDGLSANAVTACPFTFSTDKTTTAAFTVAVPTAIWSLLGGVTGSVLDVFGGEYEYDRWKVKLWSCRGADRGVSIRYGKNLTSLEQDENCANCYTGVMPFWVDPQTGAVTKLPDNIVEADGNFGYTKIMPLDLSGEFEAAPTSAELTSAAQAYMKANSIGEPVVSWKVEFVQLEQTEEYKGQALLERVLLGDTVHVDFADMGISVSARATITEFDSIQERYNSVNLGSVKADLTDTIVEQSKNIEARPDKSEMQLAIEKLTSTILGANGGAVRFLDTNGDGVPDTLYIADDPDPALAVKVWRFNYEGWGASENGYNGPFVMGATLADGFLADFIKAGTLYGILVKAGAIESDDGKISIDLSGGSEPIFNTGISTNGLTVRSDQSGSKTGIFRLFTLRTTYPDGSIGYSPYLSMTRPDGSTLLSVSVTGESQSSSLLLCSSNLTKQVILLADDDGVGGLRLVNTKGNNGSLMIDEDLNVVLTCDAVNPGKKVLFSGNVAKGGTFTVPNTANYDLFAIKVRANSTTKPGVILAYKYGDTIHGMGGWGGDAASLKETYWVSINFSGNTWTLTHGSYHNLSLTNGWSDGTLLNVEKVIGII